MNGSNESKNNGSHAESIQTESKAYPTKSCLNQPKGPFRRLFNRLFNHLWVRLTVAFIIITQLSILVIALLATWSINGEFQRYIFRRDVSSFESRKKDLVTFYESHGDWSGVDRIFIGTFSLSDDDKPNQEGVGGGVGQSNTQPNLQSSIQPYSPSGASAATGPQNVFRPLHFILADSSGKVVFDRSKERLGTTISSDEMAVSLPLVGPDDQIVGFLVPQRPPMNFEVHSPEQDFLARLQSSLMLASLIVGGIGLLLGLILSRTLAAPLATLAQAARSFGTHDWSRRVQAGGASEIAEVATAFNEMADELQRAETQRRNMIADIAHELRTPLTVMQGNLRALLDGVYPMEQGEIATLYDETRVLSRLVDDLRELALADAGRLTLHIDAVDAADMLRTTTSNFAITAEEQNIALSLEVPDQLPVVKADPDRLGQIIRNLVVNALLHTSQGSVTISAKPLPSEKRIEISVTDTGEGIVAEDLPHVFDRFYRGDKSRARTSGGTGLGLAITKAWVEAMNGSIGVESTYGKGSRFWFVLPTG